MRRLVLSLSFSLLLAGSAKLHAQAMVENALGAGRAATTTAPAAGVGKSVNGLAGAVDSLLKAAPGAASSSAPAVQNVHGTSTRGTVLPAPRPGAKYEDPVKIEAGMAYEDVLRRFGPPSLQFTDGPDSISLNYRSKQGPVRVEMEAGKVSAVDKPNS
jgi:hypothetical protein